MLTDVSDVVAALAGEKGFETFEETPKGMKGFIQQSLFDRTILDECLRQLPFEGVSISYETQEAEDKDWNAQWEKEGFQPISIGSALTIHDGCHLPTNTSGRLMVEIDAKMAFGTGNHQTTRMMGSALLGLDLQGRRILDCGTGTGILAIIALKRGAVRAVGYDIDEWSVDNARHNAAINGIPADGVFTILHGDVSVITTLNETFDVVTANINRNILLADMPRMVQVLNPGGKLLLSGFYEDDVNMLNAEASRLELRLDSQYCDDGWACLEFTLK